MPFLSSNQQCQSTEGWQCFWLGTTCCHDGSEITVFLRWLHGLTCSPASREHPSCDSNDSVPDLETACCHQVVMVSHEHCLQWRSQGGHGCMPPVWVHVPLSLSWKFFLCWIFMYFVQSNIQHVSPASGGFASQTSTGALPLDPAGDFRSPDPLFQIPGYATDCFSYAT